MIKSYLAAIREALAEEMKKDKSVFLIGEDIGFYGGAFGVTKGLYEQFGPERVIDSPMSEAAIIGLCNGAAIAGMRPVAEIMFMDFMSLCYDQLLNHAGIFNYISDGQFNVPIVIRTPAGGGRGYGATHSKTLISALMSIPGIKIVFPSSPKDAKGLLKASIRDNNPVVFIEHKLLYSLKEETPEEEYIIPLGEAEIKKEGKDVSVVAIGKSVIDSLKIANDLESQNISVEVIDLRTIKPLDIETIKKSVNKTGRVVIVAEDYSTCGLCSEISAQIVENCFKRLKAPIRRLASKDLPFPCCPSLENEIIPKEEDIKNAIIQVINEKS